MSGECGHFLSIKEQKRLHDYAKRPFHYPEEYEQLMNDLIRTVPYAFHTSATLITRKFFHCPRTPIPYYSCLRK